MGKLFSMMVLLLTSQVMAMGGRIPGRLDRTSLELESRSTLKVVQDFSLPGASGSLFRFKAGEKIPISLALRSGIDTGAELENMIQYSVTIMLASGKSFNVTNKNLRVSITSQTSESSSRTVTEACTLKDEVKVCRDGKYGDCQEYDLERSGIRTVEVTDTVFETDYQIAILVKGSVVGRISGQGLRRDSRSDTRVPCH